MNLLHIIATPRGHESNTVRISNAILEELHEKHSDLTVKILDLFKADLPSVAGENIESKYKLMTGQQLDASHQVSWKQIEANITRFLDADIYLITTPMWNFGIPYALKYYIDATQGIGYGCPHRPPTQGAAYCTKHQKDGHRRCADTRQPSPVRILS